MRISKKYLFFAISVLAIMSLIFSVCFAEKTEYPITIIDDSGITVTIEKQPETFISSAPSNTEILFSLGLGDNVIGVTNYCNYPEEVKNIEKIGEISPLNYEKILSLNPDIVLAYGGFQLKDIPRLRELNINSIVLEPLNLNDTFRSIKMIAITCGVPDKGAILVDDLKKRVDNIKTKVANIPILSQPKVFVGGTSDTIFTPGAGTLFNELITMAGGQNIAAGLSFWKKISPEFVAEAEPDIIIIPVGAMNQEENSKIKQMICARSGWSNIPAIINQKIFIVNEDIFYRAVPRLVDGLELLYEIFYE